MNNKTFQTGLCGLTILSILLSAAVLTGCNESGEDTIVLERGTNNPYGIPDDSQAGEAPNIVDPNANIPNIQTDVEGDGDDAIIRITMTGVQDPYTYDWLSLYGTGEPNQNVWVTVDGKPKGIAVYNNSGDENQSIMVDLVFTVDNSGSMGQEADAIASEIVSWAESLSKSGLNIKFGIVGYGGNVGSEYSYLVSNYGVTGALDLTTIENLNAYLNGRETYSTGRTKGYYGDNSAKLSSAASADAYSKAGGECGVQAIRFADENFCFRSGANRIYVNFTDDANYTGGNSNISVSYIQNTDNWPSYKGTIHSVISNSASGITFRCSMVEYSEEPWLLSQYTGGTIIYDTSGSFSDVTLSTLPVTGAMQHSYIIRFTNIREFMDGQPHQVVLTIRTPDGKVRAVKTFMVVFGNASN